MGIEDIRNRISVINAETSRLNTQRNQNIGKKETFEKQLKDAFKAYKANYGVTLTVETLEEELRTVTAKKEQELSKIEAILNCIKSGNIEEANRLAGLGGTSDSEPTAPSVESAISPVSPVESVVQPVVSVESVVPTVEDSPINATVSAPVDMSVPTPAAPPNNLTPPSGLTPPIGVAPPSGLTPPDFVAPPIGVQAPKTPVLTGADSLDMGIPALEGFTKPSLGTVTPFNTSAVTPPPAPPVSQVKDFGAILSGTAFNPNK